MDAARSACSLVIVILQRDAHTYKYNRDNTIALVLRFAQGHSNSREHYISFIWRGKTLFFKSRLLESFYVTQTRTAELLRHGGARRVDRSSRFSSWNARRRRLREQCGITVNSRAFLGLSCASCARHNQRRVTSRVLVDIPRGEWRH